MLLLWLHPKTTVAEPLNEAAGVQKRAERDGGSMIPAWVCQTGVTKHQRSPHRGQLWTRLTGARHGTPFGGAILQLHAPTHGRSQPISPGRVTLAREVAGSQPEDVVGLEPGKCFGQEPVGIVEVAAGYGGEPAAERPGADNQGHAAVDRGVVAAGGDGLGGGHLPAGGTRVISATKAVA